MLPPPGLARRGFKLGRGEDKMIGVLGGSEYNCWLKGAKVLSTFSPMTNKNAFDSTTKYSYGWKTFKCV